MAYLLEDDSISTRPPNIDDRLTLERFGFNYDEFVRKFNKSMEAARREVWRRCGTAYGWRSSFDIKSVPFPKGLVDERPGRLDLDKRVGGGTALISEKFRACVDAIDAEGQFYSPVEVYLPDGSLVGTYYYWYPLRFVDATDPRSVHEDQVKRGGCWTEIGEQRALECHGTLDVCFEYDIAFGPHYKDFRVCKERIAGLAAWWDRRLGGFDREIFITDALLEKLVEAKVTGIKSMTGEAMEIAEDHIEEVSCA